MEAKNILDVEKFVVASNDMLTGKFLDLNKRLEKFLSVMTKSEDILELLSDSLEDFDEEIEFEKAFSVDKKTGSASVHLPTDDKGKLAISVTIFNNLINEKLNANQFLETFFQDKKMTPMQSFLEKIVRPYRDVICKIFELDTDISADDIKRQIESEKMMQKEAEKKAEEEQFPHLDELLKEIDKTCNQILALLKFEKKRSDILDDLEFVVNSIVQACLKRDLMVINGLVIGLNYVSKKFKNVRHLVSDLNSLIYDYYEFLAGGVSE
ncbi:MAG: hypothetical protein J6J24_02015 [Clostridia bacterium]|nr:hypothetical protein [Clostridia bacterium]